jgi:hypothetical protein
MIQVVDLHLPHPFFTFSHLTPISHYSITMRRGNWALSALRRTELGSLLVTNLWVSISTRSARAQTQTDVRSATHAAQLHVRRSFSASKLLCRFACNQKSASIRVSYHCSRHICGTSQLSSNSRDSCRAACRQLRLTWAYSSS